MGIVLSVSASRGATLISFKPVPISPTIKEFDFGGGPIPDFEEGPGSIGNGDGTLPLVNQTIPGLQIDTPLSVPGQPGGTVNGDGSTTFYDTTFDITGLFATGPAINSFGTLVQPLGGANPTFQIFSTDPPGVNPPVLLLSGNISTATLAGANGGGAGAVFSAAGVTYTGGAIYTALLAAGGTANPGDLSFSLTDVSPTFSINGVSGFLNAFTANGEGSFTSPLVPEPAAIGLAGFALLMLKRRAK